MHEESWSAGTSIATAPALGLGGGVGGTARPALRRHDTRPDGGRIRIGRTAELRGDLAALRGDWLTPAERQEFARCLSRREAWLCSRLLGKRLVLDALNRPGLPLHALEICARDRAGHAARPVVRLEGNPLPFQLSISRIERAALVGLATRPGASVGVDLAPMLTHFNPAALVFWFSRQEQRELSLDDPRHLALCWAIKEAAYKAGNTGESFVPRRFEVYRSGTGQFGCRRDGHDCGEVRLLDVPDLDGHLAVSVTTPARTA